MRGLKLVTLIGCAAVLWGGLSPHVYGQTASGAKPPAAPPPVTLDIRDGSLRAALSQLFESAHVQYSIDNRVSGYVTLHILDQPFDTALRLLLHSSGQTLIYRVEDGVYFVEPRAVTPPSTQVSLASAASSQPSPKSSTVDVITLINADPYDLMGLLGITVVRTGTRFDGMGGNTGQGTANGGIGARTGATGGIGGSSGGGSSPLGGGNWINSDANNDLIRTGS